MPNSSGQNENSSASPLIQARIEYWLFFPEIFRSAFVQSAQIFFCALFAQFLRISVCAFFRSFFDVTTGCCVIQSPCFTPCHRRYTGAGVFSNILLLQRPPSPVCSSVSPDFLSTLSSSRRAKASPFLASLNNAARNSASPFALPLRMAA